MRINVGSANPIKVEAVKEIIADYDFLIGSEVLSIPIKSEVPEQPLSLEETINGARNRAGNSFRECTYSVGIEDGLMYVPKSITGHMNICVAVFFDGREYYFGISSAFEYPKEVTQLIFQQGLDVDSAFYRCHLTSNPDVGSAEGAIGILTKGRLTRKEYTKQALKMALISLENKERY